MNSVALLGETAIAQLETQLQQWLVDWQQRWRVTPTEVSVSCYGYLQRNSVNQIQHASPQKAFSWLGEAINWRQCLWGDEAASIPDDQVCRSVVEQAQASFVAEIRQLFMAEDAETPISARAAFVFVTVLFGQLNISFAFVPKKCGVNSSQQSLVSRHHVAEKVLAKMNVTLDLGTTHVAALYPLQVGQIITSDKNLSSHFSLNSEKGVPLLRVQLGRIAQHRAVVINN